MATRVTVAECPRIRAETNSPHGQTTCAGQKPPSPRRQRRLDRIRATRPRPEQTADQTLPGPIPTFAAVSGPKHTRPASRQTLYRLDRLRRQLIRPSRLPARAGVPNSYRHRAQLTGVIHRRPQSPRASPPRNASAAVTGGTPPESSISRQKWHATWCPSPVSASSGSFGRAAFPGPGAAGMESTRRGGFTGLGTSPGKMIRLRFASTTGSATGTRDRRARVYGCRGRWYRGVAICNFHQLAEVHHRDPVADVADDLEVMCDEEVSDAQALLQILQQVNDLGLD